MLARTNPTLVKNNPFTAFQTNATAKKAYNTVMGVLVTASAGAQLGLYLMPAQSNTTSSTPSIWNTPCDPKLGTDIGHYPS